MNETAADGHGMLDVCDGDHVYQEIWGTADSKSAHGEFAAGESATTADLPAAPYRSAARPA